MNDGNGNGETGGKVTGNGGNVIGGNVSLEGLGMVNGNGGMVNGSGGMVSGGAGASCFNARRLPTTGTITPSKFSYEFFSRRPC